jgi:type IV pilus assembly protein PilY1
MNFSTANRTSLRPYLQAADDNEAEAIIRYVHGEDDSFVIGGNHYPPTDTYRPRKVKADLDNDGLYTSTVDGIPEGTPRVWKLGDVLNSTPKISSWIPLNQFHRTYSDTTYGDGTTGGYINTGSSTTSNYKNRGMVFTGSNDGVLHAFNLGKLELSWGGQQATEKARMTSPVTGTYGEEMWAFIPKNVLPYLTYQKETDYCHIYSVDLTPYVFDASVNKPAGCTETDYWNCAKTTDSWRTILIGGMRYGGACRKTGSTCTDCVKTPITDPADATKGLGYSSYFALDITEQNNPKLLWEWDGTVLNTSTGVYENHLGFSTTGPAIVKINARNLNADSTASVADKTKNGRWFAVVGSGPTGPVGASQQFMGSSDQLARLFVIDVKNGPTAGNFWEVSSGISSSFIGSMINANNDTDLDYQDDVVYAPYVNKPALGTTWTDGGILRLLTNEDLDGSNLSGSTGNTALNPGNWGLNTVVSGVGPMTSAVARLQNPKKGQLWLFGGTGRYYYEIGPVIDDETTQRHIFGIKDPCFSSSGFDSACSTTRSLSDLTNVTDIANVPANPDDVANGWYVSLDAAGNFAYTENGSLITRPYRAEREITDPLATTSGLVFFTTYKPYGDECAVGGKSFIWATKYDTGGAAGALLKGKALVQVSTGSIEQVNLSSAFTAAGGRKSYAMEGVPPTAQGLSILSTPPPIKRVLHIRER